MQDLDVLEENILEIYQKKLISIINSEILNNLI